MGAAELLRGHRGTSARVDADFPCGRERIFCADGHGSSVRIRVENGRNQKANLCATTLKDGETRCKDRSNYHYRNRTYLEMKYE